MSLDLDIDQFLSGSSRTAFKEKDGVPHTSSGPIVNIGEVRQARDFETGKPKFYPDSTDPIKELPVTFNTDERDPDVEGDNGDRTMYFSGNSLTALRTALKNAGNAKLRVGGHLSITKTQKPSERNGKPKNHWAITYTPAAGGTDAFLDSTLEPSATPSVPAGSPAPATNAAAIAAKLAAAVATPKVDPAIDGLPEEHKAAIKNLTPQQAAAAQLEAQHKALRPDLYA